MRGGYSAEGDVPCGAMAAVTQRLERPDGIPGGSPGLSPAARTGPKPECWVGSLRIGQIGGLALNLLGGQKKREMCIPVGSEAFLAFGSACRGS